MAQGLLSPDDVMYYGSEGAVDPVMASAVPEMGLLMMPSSGISEMLGYAPDPFSEGYLPSTAELVRRGDLEGLGYQAIGVGGDLLYAASPFLPFLAPAAVTAKGVRAANISKNIGLNAARRQGIIKDVDEAVSYNIDRPIDKKQPAKGGLYGRGSDDFEKASDVTVQRQTVEGLAPDKTAPTMQQLEGLLGETFVPVYWDRASTNEIPTTIGRYSGLSAPATQGGIGFMRQVQPQLVASVPSIATKVANRADKVRKQLGGKDPLVFQMTMAPQGIDFSTHPFEQIVEMLPQSKISKSDAEIIDAHMRSGKQGDPNWPGVLSPKLSDYLFNQITGTQRANLMKKWDSATVAKTGAPSAMEARVAATDARLLHEPQYFGGATIGRFTGGRGEEGLLHPHRTYAGYVGGDYVGGLEGMLPTSILFRDYIEQRGYMDKANNYLPIPDSDKMFNPEMVKVAVERGMPASKIDEQMLEEADFFINELRKRK